MTRSTFQYYVVNDVVKVATPIHTALLHRPRRRRSGRLAQEAEGASGRLNKQQDEHGSAAARRPFLLVWRLLRALGIAGPDRIRRGDCDSLFRISALLN
jgi:hypothetical protein